MIHSIVSVALCCTLCSAAAIAEERPRAAASQNAESEQAAEARAFGEDKLVAASNVTHYLACDNTVASTVKFRVMVEYEATDGSRGFVPVKQRVGVGEFEPGYFTDHGLRVIRVRWLWKYRDSFFAQYFYSDWADAPKDQYIVYGLLTWEGKTGWQQPKIWTAPRP